MSLLKRIQSRVQRDYCKYQFHRAVAHVDTTPPLSKGKLPFVLLSMVHKRDVESYLLALKSFTAHANPERVIMVCDPTITDADRRFLLRHVPHLELRDAIEFINPAIPRGGCWERLHAISTLSSEAYVIQLDADTVTINTIPEIVTAVHAGVGFVLGEERDQSLLTLLQSSSNARSKLGPNPHIQTISEANLDCIGLPSERLYVRGCAGFTGFPRMPGMRDALFDFSARMADKMGVEKWASWGTEQVTSNFLVANAPGTCVLPFPKYATPDVLCEETSFLHFIGSMRFTNTIYEQTARQTIKALRQ
jgi:hypothetical protein